MAHIRTAICFSRRARTCGGRIATACAAGLLILAACGAPEETAEIAPPPPEPAPSEAVEPPQPQLSILTRNIGSYPVTLDPHRATTLWEFTVIGDMLTGLMTEGPDGAPIYGMARDHDVSDDRLVYRFFLRDDAVWSDGTPVTADDFAFSFRRLLDPAAQNPYAAIIFPIENAEEVADGRAAPEALGVQALDPLTLEIRLTTPAPYFLDLLTHASTYPAPAHRIAELGDGWTEVEAFVGNGAYIPTEQTPGESIRLRRNDLFFAADEVAIDEVVFVAVADPYEALQQFADGAIDISQGRNGYPADQIADIDTRFPGARRAEVLLSVEYLVANTTRAPLDDPRIRQALSLLIDREALTAGALSAPEAPAWSLAPPGAANYVIDAPVIQARGLTLEERQSRARALLESAGYSSTAPLRIELTVRGADLETRQVYEAISEMWREANVLTQIMAVDPGVAYERFARGEFELGNVGWNADYNDPRTFLFPATVSAGALNFARYANPEVDALLEEAAQTVDLQSRAQALAQAETILLADLPMIPLFHAVSRNLVASRVQGWAENPIGMHRTRFLSLEPQQVAPPPNEDQSG